MKQLLWPIGWNSQHCHIAARGPQQTSHQIHQGRLARAIGTHQTGNPGRNGETHAIHAENLAIEFRDVVERDCILERVSHLNNPTSLPLPLGEGWGEGLAMSQSLFVVSSSEPPAKKEKGFFHRSSLPPPPGPLPKGEGEIHLTTSYALTFRDSSHRQNAQIRNSMNQDAHNGGSLMITCRTTLPFRNSSMSPVWRTNVPNNPDQAFPISARKSNTSPQPPPKIPLITSAKMVGIKKTPSSDARAASRHFTQAEIA